MDEVAEKKPFAWQPLTSRGIAAFAAAPVSRLWWIQLLVAILGAATAVWLVRAACFSAVDEAIGHLPAQGDIRGGVLDWRGDSPVVLAEGHFLAFAVDLRHEGDVRSPAHFAVEFGHKDLRVFSLLGCLSVRYPPDWRTAFNRPELEPRWGAWRATLLGLVAGATLAGLMLSWLLLATIYCVPMWLGCRLGKRALSLGGAWRVAGASLMPGALFMVLVLAAYGLGVLDLIRLAAGAALHLAIGWVCLVRAARRLPVRPVAAAPANPFAANGAES